MSCLKTKTEDGDFVFTHARQVVIIEWRDRKSYFYATCGLLSYIRWSLEEARQWLDEHHIDYVQIETNKLACTEHVHGFRTDDSLVYNPLFYYPLPEVYKEMYRAHSITAHFKSKWIKKHDEEQQALKKKREACAAKYCVPAKFGGFVVFNQF